jgi:hypothetical protein
MNARTVVRVALVAILGCSAAIAPTVAEARQAAQKPAAEPVSVRLKLVVDRTEGDKVVSTTPFELVVRANVGGVTSLNHGRSVPVAQTTFLPVAAGGAPTQPQVSYAYQSIGSNLHISGMTANDKLVSFELMVDVSSLEAPSKDAASPGPTFRKFTMQMQVSVRAGEATVVATSTDRMTGETARLTVLADIVR